MPVRRRDGLTAQQARFVEAYLANGRQASAAYRLAYKASGMQPRTIAARAREELRKPAIAAVVAKADEKAAEATERAMDRYAVTKARLAEELSYLALLDPADVVAHTIRAPKDIAKLPERVRRAIVGWSYDARGNFILKFADKRAAAMDLAELERLITKKVEHSGPGGGPIEQRIVDERKRPEEYLHEFLAADGVTGSGDAPAADDAAGGVGVVPPADKPR